MTSLRRQRSSTGNATMHDSPIACVTNARFPVVWRPRQLDCGTTHFAGGKTRINGAVAGSSVIAPPGRSSRLRFVGAGGGPPDPHQVP
jgi:hypothetical protein